MSALPALAACLAAESEALLCALPATFCGLPVGGPGSGAPNLRVGFTPAELPTARFPEFLARLERFAAEPLEGLVLGAWDAEPGEVEESGELLEALARLAPGWPGLRRLFLGEVPADCLDPRELELPRWTGLPEHFPRLEHLRVNALTTLGPLRAPALRSLTLMAAVDALDLEELGRSRLPRLEILELWLGDAARGGLSEPAALLPLLSGKLFPGLRCLALRNSDRADELAELVAGAPLLERLEALDLSGSALGDEGAEALLAAPALRGLRSLDLHHHRLSAASCARLEALGLERLVLDSPGAEGLLLPGLLD